MKNKLLTLIACALYLISCNEQDQSQHLKGADKTDSAAIRKIPVLTIGDTSTLITGRKRRPRPIVDTTLVDSVIPVPPPPAPIPSSYALTMPPVGYQGSEGSCVAWAVAYGARSCMQYYKTGATAYSNATNVFSPEYVFNQVKASSNCSSAGMLRSVDLLVSQGVCTWQSMPYNYLDGCSLMPNSSQTAEASNYKIASYARVQPSDVVTIKTMIASQKPVPFTFNTDGSFDRATAGFIWTTYTGFTGAHAMVLCGYDDAKHAYKAMNCWGISWGDAGYIWIDYDLLPVISFEAYVMNL